VGKVEVKEKSVGAIGHNQGERDKLQKMNVGFVTRLDIEGFNMKPKK